MNIINCVYPKNSLEMGMTTEETKFVFHCSANRPSINLRMDFHYRDQNFINNNVLHFDLNIFGFMIMTFYRWKT